MPTATTPPKNR